MPGSIQEFRRRAQERAPVQAPGTIDAEYHSELGDTSLSPCANCALVKACTPAVRENLHAAMRGPDESLVNPAELPSSGRLAEYIGRAAINGDPQILYNGLVQLETSRTPKG